MADDTELARARAVAVAAAAARAAQAQQQQPQQPAPDPNRGFGAFALRGGIDALAAPADLATYPQRVIGRALGFDMDAPSTGIADLVRGLGLPVAEEGVRAETRSERIGEGFGTATGFLLPGAGAVGAATRFGGPVLRGAAEAIRAPFVRAPVTALTAEMAAGAGAGLLGYEAERAAEGTAVPPELARIGGELVGGFGGAALPTAIGSAGRLAGSLMDMTPGLATARRVATQIVNPQQAAMERASASIQSRLAGTPEEALDALYSETLLDLTPAQRINQPRILQLEQDVLLRDPVLDARYRERREAAQAQVREEFGALGGGGSIRDTARAMEDWVTTSREALERTVADAASAAEAAALRAGPRTTAGPADLSAAFREELDNAYRRVRSEESALWQAVPLDVVARTDNAGAQYFTAMQQATRIREGQIPATARRFLDPESPDYLGGSATAREMQALSSALREEARAARSQGQAFTAMMADDLADAVTRDLDAVPGVGGPLDAARSFSRVFNEVYRQGPIGQVLGTTRAGGERVSPEETLRRLIGGDRERLVAGAEAVEAAVGPAAPLGGTSLPAQGLASDYLRRQFVDTLVPESGQMRLGRAETFVANRREMLDRYPRLAQLFDDSIAAARAAESTRRTVEDDLAALARSPAQRLVDAPVHQEFQTILTGSQNPAFEFSELMSIAQQSGPEAVDGLRSAAASFLLNGAQARRAGDLVLEGSRINRALADPRTMDAMTEVFTPEQLSRVQRLADELSIFEASRAARGGDAARLIEPDAVDTVLGLAARVLGATAGRALTPPGGATIQNPQIGSQFMRGLARRLTTDDAEKLIVDAISGDTALFEALLTNRSAGPQFDRAQEVISLWMANNVAQSTNQIDEAMADFEQGLGLRPRQPLRIEIPGP